MVTPVIPAENHGFLYEQWLGNVISEGFPRQAGCLAVNIDRLYFNLELGGGAAGASFDIIFDTQSQMVKSELVE